MGKKKAENVGEKRHSSSRCEKQQTARGCCTMLVLGTTGRCVEVRVHKKELISRIRIQQQKKELHSMPRIHI